VGESDRELVREIVNRGKEKKRESG